VLTLKEDATQVTNAADVLNIIAGTSFNFGGKDPNVRQVAEYTF